MYKCGFWARNYAQALCVKEKGMDKSWEKGEKFGRQALSSQISREKKMGHPIMYAHACSFELELCTCQSQDGRVLLAKP